MGKIANAGYHRTDGNTQDDYRIQDWYNHPWDAVLRPPTQIAELAANIAIAACNNNNIIYVWGGSSYWAQLQANNYDPSAITTQCGTDCMGTCFQNIKAACARLGISENLPTMSTSQADKLIDIGATKFTDSDHVATDANALRGDVYVDYSQHACMYVGDGELNGYSGTDSSGTSGGISGINVEALSPYVIGVPSSAKTFDGDMFKDSQVCGVMLSAGYLYASKTHSKRQHYVATNLKAQSECADSYGLPYALCAEVRAHTVAEAKLECEQLYYVVSAYPPRMSLWLHLDMNQSTEVNERIVDYYYEECGSWGFQTRLGIYVTDDELQQITWDNYYEKFFLWKVDHDQEVDEWVKVLPFSKIVSGSISSSGSSAGSYGTGQEYASASDKQKAIVNACHTTASPGSGWCAAWVTYVYQNAGAGSPGGNACDMYWNYCKYSDKSQLQVGMIIAVPSHPGTSAGRIYGHVGIYVGDGTIMHNVGSIESMSLDNWISYYGKTYTPKWGFATSSGSL